MSFVTVGKAEAEEKTLYESNTEIANVSQKIVVTTLTSIPSKPFIIISLHIEENI